MMTYLVHRRGVASRVPTLQPGGPGSIPAGSGILISILGMGVCPLCSVLCFLWRWPWYSADHRFQGGPTLCICLLFWSKVCSPPTGMWPIRFWVVTPTLGRINNRWRNKDDLPPFCPVVFNCFIHSSFVILVYPLRYRYLTWLTPLGPYRATICRERELFQNHVHTFLTI